MEDKLVVVGLRIVIQELLQDLHNLLLSLLVPQNQRVDHKLVHTRWLLLNLVTRENWILLDAALDSFVIVVMKEYGDLDQLLKHDFVH